MKKTRKKMASIKATRPTLSADRWQFLADLNALGASRELLCEEIMMTDAEYAAALVALPRIERRAMRNLRQALREKAAKG